MRACFLRLWLGPALVTLQHVTDSSDCAAVKLNFNTLSTTRENIYKYCRKVQAITTEENFLFVHRLLIYGRVYQIQWLMPIRIIFLKNRLHKHWLDQDLYYFHSELTGTGGASICI